jgi:ribosomal protein S21
MKPVAVELARPERERATYESYFGCRVRFGSSKDRLTFLRADLDKSFAAYNAELLDVLIPELDKRLDRLSHQKRLSDQIKWILRRRLAAGRPDVRSVAVELQEGESLENALRRFNRKVQTEDFTKEVKCHSYYLKPGEAAIV